MDALSILAQTPSSGDGAWAALAVVTGLLGLALVVLTLSGYWKVFTRIGLPGWMGIVPFGLPGPAGQRRPGGRGQRGERLTPRPAPATVLRTQHPSTWSFTSPMACMNA